MSHYEYLKNFFAELESHQPGDSWGFRMRLPARTE